MKNLMEICEQIRDQIEVDYGLGPGDTETLFTTSRRRPRLRLR